MNQYAESVHQPRGFVNGNIIPLARIARRRYNACKDFSGKGVRCVRGQTKKLAISALLLASDVILTRVLAFNTPIMKIGLGFAATALCAMLYGPWWAAGVAALGDVLGALLFPTGLFFPGFTLTAACTGLLFGLCLYRRGENWRFPLLAAGLNCVLVSYLANTAMIAYISGTDYAALLGVRAVQLTVMLPLQALVLLWLTRSKLIRRLLDEAR